MPATSDDRGSERSTLREFLDDQREALISRVLGLGEKEARSTPTASSLSLLGLVKHAAVWERRWFQVVVAGRRLPGEWPEVPDDESGGEDPTFRLAPTDTVASVVAEYRAAIAAADEIVAGCDLDAPVARTDKLDENVRWVVVHLIEETARHAGHADIIRESIDGTRGR